MYSNLVSPSIARMHRTYTDIKKRLRNIQVDVERYIQSDLKVYESPLDGISFKTQATDPVSPTDFLAALRIARKTGKPAFREGKKFNQPHWAVDASMAATTGIGFREITYLDSASSTGDSGSSLLRMRAPSMDQTFSAQFGTTQAKVDISSLHCAVWGDLCSIHIDETGFVLKAMPGFGNDVIMTADFLQHTLLELIWKDKLGMPDGVEIHVPNSANHYSRFGLRATANLSNSVRLSVDASYNIRGKRGFSKTLVLEGVF